MGMTVILQKGARLQFHGELVEVVEVEATRVAIRDARNGWRTVSLTEFLISARGEQPEEDPGPSLGLRLAGLSDTERQAVAKRAAHIREFLTGYRSGSAASGAPGEPRPAYNPALPLTQRQQAKARELGVADRTIRRWAAAYAQAGEAGLIDPRMIAGRRSAVDPRWEQACQLVMGRKVRDSTPTIGALLREVEKHLDIQYGPGEVPRPSTATAYRHLGRLAKGTNAVKGSAKGRRSISERPPQPYGRLRAERPGEYAILDTQDLDVFAMEPVTCRWVPVQLTVVQDLFTRCITGLRVTPVSTKAVDVAGVLYESVVPHPVPDDWPAGAHWAYHGIPRNLVMSEDRPLAGVPVCPPETIVIDHGKAFLSAHVISVCTRLGISIQPAQPKKPTDKPTVERFFRTLREGLIQYLPAYKGPDVYSRGEGIEDRAFYFIHELEDVIREWIALVYHRTKHEGLTLPEWPGLPLSPNKMYEVGVAKAGFLRIPYSLDLAYDFLEVVPRTLQHYGVEIRGLRYDGDAIRDYKNTKSPYGGELNGYWPIRVNPDDVRCVYFQDPGDGTWHRLHWEHAAAIGTPFSTEAARYARRLAAAESRHPNREQALAELLARWDAGMVTGRRERRIAARLAAERRALDIPDPESPAQAVAALPSLARNQRPGDRDDGEAAPPPEPAAPEPGDDDDEDEIFDEPGDDYYSDAFGVVE
jgi:transposase InsO family protein